MPTKHHFTNEFKSQHGLDYKVEIWHKTTEVTATTEIKSGTPGFLLIYKKIKDPILGGMMPSTLTFKYLVENATDLSNAHGILTAQNENFYIKVYRKSVNDPDINYLLWWFGWVTSGFDGYADKAFPYVLNVKATCSLNKQLNKYNNQVDVASQSDYRDLSYPLQLFEDNYNIDTITPAIYYLFAWQTNWWNQQTGTPSVSVNPIRKTFYNRAAFVTNPENFPLTINNYVEEIKGVLKSFMMRTMLSSGKYHVQQVRELDTATPNPIYSLTADGTAELTPDIVGYPSGISDQVVIDNTANPSDSNKAVIKKGANFSIRQEAKSIRAKYIFGNNFCNIPIGLDYTAGNIALGFVAQGTTNLQLFLNVVMKQTFPLTGASAVTPVNSNQGMYMSGVLNITLKIGNKYLKRQGGTTNPMDLVWTTAVSSVDFFTGSGTYYSNTLNSLYESQNSVQDFLNQFGGDYPYPFTQWQNDNPSTGTALATSRFYVPGIVLPDLGSTFGQVEFAINAANSYNLFWTNMTSFVSPFTDLSDWISLYNPAASTNLDYNTSTNTPAASLTKTFDLGVVPYLSDITADEENATDDESSPIGAIYYASQSGNNQAPDIDLGDLALGTNSSSNQINTLRAKDASNNYIETGKFRVGNTGAYISTGQLLCNEYLKSKDEPVVTLTASIISTSYEAHRTIFYEDKIGGTGARYVFGGGKFNPMDDNWSGIWYKLNLGSTPTESSTTIYNPVPPIDTTPGGGNLIGKAAPQNNELGNYKAGFMLNNLIVATTDADITAGVALAKIDTTASVAKVYNNQKLIIADKYLRNITEIIVNGDKNSGVTSIDFASITPAINYPTGSFLLLKSNDLSNVITGGGGNTTKVINVLIKNQSSFLFYAFSQNNWYSAGSSTFPTLGTGSAPSVLPNYVSHYQSRIANFTALETCTLKKLIFTFNWTSSAVTGNLDLEFAFTKFTPITNGVANPINMIAITATNTTGTFTSNKPYQVEFTFSGNNAVFSAGQSFGFHARSVNSSNNNRVFIYGVAVLKVEI